MHSKSSTSPNLNTSKEKRKSLVYIDSDDSVDSPLSASQSSTTGINTHVCWNNLVFLTFQISFLSKESKHVQTLKSKVEGKPKAGAVTAKVKSIGDLIDSKGSFWGDYNETDTVGFENNGIALFIV